MSILYKKKEGQGQREKLTSIHRIIILQQNMLSDRNSKSNGGKSSYLEN